MMLKNTLNRGRAAPSKNQIIIGMASRHGRLRTYSKPFQKLRLPDGKLFTPDFSAAKLSVLLWMQVSAKRHGQLLRLGTAK